MPMFSLDFGSRKDYDYPTRKGSAGRSLSRSESDETLQGSLKKKYGQPYYKSAVEASGKLDFGELELELWDSRYMLKGYKEPNRFAGWCKPSCIPISIILVLIVLVVVLSLLDQKWEDEKLENQILLQKQWADCRDSCRIELLESIPEGLYYNESDPKHKSTFEGWKELIQNAKSEIKIGSYYWSLRGDHPTANEGNEIFRLLMEAGKDRGVSVKVAYSSDSKAFPNEDLKELVKSGAAEARAVNFTRLLGAGILHTKIWIIDQVNVYIGSANQDWRSLTQVKELGVLVSNCSCYANDLNKIFDVYWNLGGDSSKIPDKWPKSLETIYNAKNPMNISFNGLKYTSYISSSPQSFCPKGRTPDLDAILSIIDNSTRYVHIAVMDYFPVVMFANPIKYWPDIDSRLRSAALDRKISVKILMSKWVHTRSFANNFLQSLLDLNGVLPNVDIQIKMFIVNSTAEQAKLDHCRVNHNKYMVTDKTAYIGTSNWSGDYFISTGGVGFIASGQGNETTSNPSNVRSQLASIFDRDWNSAYAHKFNTSHH